MVYPEDGEHLGKHRKERAAHHVRMNARLEEIMKNPQLAQPYIVGFRMSCLDRLHGGHGGKEQTTDWMKAIRRDPQVAFVQGVEGENDPYEDICWGSFPARVFCDMAEALEARNTFTTVEEFDCVGMMGLDIRDVFKKVDWLGKVGFSDPFDNTDVYAISWYVVGPATDQKVIAIVEVDNEYDDGDWGGHDDVGDGGRYND